MSSWNEAMADLGAVLMSSDVFGSTMIFNGVTIPCIKNPVKSGFITQLTNQDKVADTTVDIFRDVFVSSGLAAATEGTTYGQKRPQVTIQGEQYEVFQLENDDTTNPMVRLPCKLLQ